MGRSDATSSSPVGRLSNELLSSILLQVKLDSGAPSFLPCLLCCKAWYGVALPLLYHDVFLSHTNLEPFVQHLKVSTGSLVRSLTLRIDPVRPELEPDAPHPYAFLEDEEDMRRHGSQGSQRLWGHLRDIATTLANMVGLISFALYISPEKNNVGFWLPRSAIAAIIEALPESCFNLEIDSRGNDSSEPDSAHLCDAVSATLPRLQNLRLRLSTMCPAIFGAGFDSSAPAKFFSNFQPVATSTLQTVLINCVPGNIFGSRASICGPSQESLYDHWSEPDPQAYFAFVDCLRLGVARLCYPAAKRLSVVMALPHDNADQAVYPALLRGDILENQASVLPFRNIIGMRSNDGYLVRTFDDQEIFTYPWVVDALVEDKFWAETKDGYRLPAMLLGTESTLYAVDHMPIQSTGEWKVKYPRIGCGLWSNERMTESRLLQAERREGLKDVTPIKEKTPPGFHRIYEGSDLERDTP